MPGILSKHHQHTLEAVVVTPQRGSSIECSGCRLLCCGTVYVCNLCNCVLHRSCATAPGKIEHPCHKGHVLAFADVPQYSDGRFSCDACGEEGRGFSFHCTACSYDLHIPCAYYPTQVNHGTHEHPLSLLYANPYPHSSFICHICGGSGFPSSWLYHCPICSFDAHLQCADCPRPPNNITHQRQVTPRQLQPTRGNSFANTGHVRPYNQMQTISNEAMRAFIQQLMSMNSPGGGTAQQNPLAAFIAGSNNPSAALFQQLFNGNGPMGAFMQQFVNGGGDGGFGPMGSIAQQFLDAGGGDVGFGLLMDLFGGGMF